MTKENLVSIVISSDDLEEISATLKTIQNILTLYVVSVSTEDRQNQLKINEKTGPFVKKVLEYAASHPEFAPSCMNIPDLKKDAGAFDVLYKIGKPLSDLASALTDTAVFPGSEAYVAALSYYNSIKQGVKMNIHGAKVIFFFGELPG